MGSRCNAFRQHFIEKSLYLYLHLAGCKTHLEGQSIFQIDTQGKLMLGRMEGGGASKWVQDVKDSVTTFVQRVCIFIYMTHATLGRLQDSFERSEDLPMNVFI